MTTGNITDQLFKRFGVGAFVSSSKKRVFLRRIAGKLQENEKGNFQAGLTVPTDVMHREDVGFLYDVHRDGKGNYVFIKTNEFDRATRERYG